MKKCVILGIVFAFALKVFSEPIEVDSIESLEEILQQQNKLMLFEMYADWCRACRILKPILAQVSEKTQEENVQIYRINVDRNSQISAALRVQSIPHVFFFKNGRFIYQMLGVNSKEEYIAVIRNFQTAD